MPSHALPASPQPTTRLGTLAAAAATLALLATGALPAAQAAPITFSNATALDIPDDGAGSGNGASSGIAVSGATGTVTGVTVRLNGLSHSFGQDLEFFLQGPLGQVVVLMNEVGGGSDWTANLVTFSDGASVIDNGSPGNDGTFAPTNANPGGCVAAPCATAGSVLSVFNGLNPNGTWTLLAFDDHDADGGSVANGWSLIIDGVTVTSTPVPEPASLALLGAGLLGLTLTRRRRAA